MLTLLDQKLSDYECHSFILLHICPWCVVNVVLGMYINNLSMVVFIAGNVEAGIVNRMALPVVLSKVPLTQTHTHNTYTHARLQQIGIANFKCVKSVGWIFFLSSQTFSRKDKIRTLKYLSPLLCRFPTMQLGSKMLCKED